MATQVQTERVVPRLPSIGVAPTGTERPPRWRADDGAVDSVVLAMPVSDQGGVALRAWENEGGHV